MMSTPKKQSPLTPEERQAFAELGCILRSIHHRIIAEHGEEYLAQKLYERKRETTESDQERSIPEPVPDLLPQKHG